MWFPLFRLTFFTFILINYLFLFVLFTFIFLFSSPLKFCFSSSWRNFEALPPHPQPFWGAKLLPGRVGHGEGGTAVPRSRLLSAKHSRRAGGRLCRGADHEGGTISGTITSPALDTLGD